MYNFFIIKKLKALASKEAQNVLYIYSEYQKCLSTDGQVENGFQPDSVTFFLCVLDKKIAKDYYPLSGFRNSYKIGFGFIDALLLQRVQFFLKAEKPKSHRDSTTLVTVALTRLTTY